MTTTEIMGLKPIKLGQELNLKSGIETIKNIEYINMMVDRFDFESGHSLFSGELKENMTEVEFNKLRLQTTLSPER